MTLTAANPEFSVRPHPRTQKKRGRFQQGSSRPRPHKVLGGGRASPPRCVGASGRSLRARLPETSRGEGCSQTKRTAPGHVTLDRHVLGSATAAPGRSRDGGGRPWGDVRGRARQMTNGDALPPGSATGFPLADATVPAKGAGSPVLAALLPFGARRLPTAAAPSGEQETRPRAHAPIIPEGRGRGCRSGRGGKEKGIPTCGISGGSPVPEVGFSPLTVDGARDRASAGSWGSSGVCRLREGAVPVSENEWGAGVPKLRLEARGAPAPGTGNSGRHARQDPRTEAGEQWGLPGCGRADRTGSGRSTGVLDFGGRAGCLRAGKDPEVPESCGDRAAARK